MVELSVVLVVIGLVFVGVLKMEQVYRNYKIRQVVNQAQELSAVLKGLSGQAWVLAGG